MPLVERVNIHIVCMLDHLQASKLIRSVCEAIKNHLQNDSTAQVMIQHAQVFMICGLGL